MPAAPAGAVVAASSSAVDAAQTPAHAQVFILINPPHGIGVFPTQT
jgi:hypothetical protein